MLEKYSSLPMLLDEATIAASVDEILREASVPSVSRLDVAEALGGMLDRQTAHYKPFNHETTEKIQSWIVESWQPESAPLVDAVATLIASSDMPEARRLLDDAAQYSKDPEVRRIAEETLEEIRATRAEDP